MTCRQRGYIGVVRFADCQRPPRNSEELEDFRQAAIVERWSVAAEKECDRRARVHGVSVPCWGCRVNCLFQLMMAEMSRREYRASVS